MRFREAVGLVIFSLLLPIGAGAQGEPTVSESFVLSTEGETKGSFHVRDMAIEEALHLLLKEEGISVVVDPSLRGTVDLSIDSAAPGEILNLMARMHGFSYQMQGDILIVEPQETRQFLLEIVQSIDEELVDEDIKAEWAEIRVGLEDLLSEDGQISIHERSGVIVVRDDPRVLDRIGAYLDRIRERMTKQVQIEARIVEVRLEDSFEAGVDWSVLGDVLDGDFVAGLPGDVLASQRTVTGDGAFRFGILRPGKVDLVVEALAEETDARVVARPRLLTSANRRASVQVTERVPYITKQVSREGGVAFTDFQVEFEDAGVQMEVAALPTAEGKISLVVRPVVSTVTGYTPSLPDLGPQPIVDIRETMTSLAVRNEETLVISGLIQERKIRTTRGLPLLSQLPLLGYLFRHTSDSVQRVELIVLLTPTIVGEETGRAILQRDVLRMLEHRLDVLSPDLGRTPAGKGGGSEALRSELAADRTEAALAAYAEGRYDAAAALGQQALQLLPRSAPLKNNLGLFLRDAGRTMDAERILRSVLDHDPELSAARNNLAVLLLREGRVQEAILVLDEGLHRETDPTRRAGLESNRAAAWVLLGKAGEAG